MATCAAVIIGAKSITRVTCTIIAGKYVGALVLTSSIRIFTLVDICKSVNERNLAMH